MKIYVDELPKSCDKCYFCEYFDKDAHGKGKHEVACYFAGSIGNILYGNQISPKTCSLQSLADHDKQVRKEVCERVETELLDISHEYWRVFKQNGKQYMTDDDIEEKLDIILDQIQAGFVEKVEEK